MNAATNDWLRQPLTAFLWWCLPLGLGFSMNFLAVPPRTAALVWTALLVWMGTGCVLNARRCHRLHCYISGPVFLFGAVATALFAAQLLHGRLNNAISIVLVLALLSFVPEVIWSRYKRAQH
ncbi:MAG TPA: hypothetical protein VHX61_20550 [Rhizomicrobium sp.]|jgi:hypothetical protein|nr:hypothetical protein [Rhizomicrobium sp.]